MEDIEFKKIASVGRARGRSMLSILRATEEEHGGGGESQSAGETPSRPIKVNTARGNEGEALLRPWCTGLPPKKSFLTTDGASSPKFPLTRRSTLADKLELDVQLTATKIVYKAHLYLPLTASNIRRLLKFVNGSKPIADMKLFDCILIDHEVNDVHADHVVAVLERIGEHCNHLLIKSPIQTSELGNVFNHEADNISAGNDWACILKCFPNLEHLAFIHPITEPIDLARGTFFALQMAVANRQAAQQVKRFTCDGPPELLTYFHHNLTTALTTASNTNTT